MSFIRLLTLWCSLNRLSDEPKMMMNLCDDSVVLITGGEATWQNYRRDGLDPTASSVIRTEPTILYGEGIACVSDF